MVDDGTDPRLGAVLSAFGVGPETLLGRGGEAAVYALDHDRVLRVLHDGGSAAGLPERAALVDELRLGASSFALPEVLAVGEVNGRVYAVERRLPGRSVLDGLADLAGPDRDRLVEHHLDAAAALSVLPLHPRGWYGELIGSHPVRTASWRDFLVARAAYGLRTPGFQHLSADALADDLPASVEASFVHLDAFAGNMMAVGTTVTAVIDIGVTSAYGDPDLDAVAGAVYLCAGPITPVATARDRSVALGWLRDRGLADRYEATRRWLAAYWCWAVDDLNLHSWCRSVLLDR